MEKFAKLLLEEIVDLILLKDPESKIDNFYRIQVRELLELDLMQAIEISFWKNLDEKQAEHFEQFVENRYVQNPVVDEKLLFMDFASLYSDLLEKIHLDILIFLEEFVERFDD